MKFLLAVHKKINTYCIYSATGIFFNETTFSNSSPYSLHTNPIKPPLKSSQIISLSILAIAYTCLTQIRQHQKLGRLNMCISTAATA